MAIYIVGQSNLRIILETDVNLSTNDTLLIKYKNPEGTTGSWSATISTDTSKIYYDVVSTTDINIAGKWYFWAHATFADATVGKGAAASQTFIKEGDV